MTIHQGPPETVKYGIPTGEADFGVANSFVKLSKQFQKLRDTNKSVDKAVLTKDQRKADAQKKADDAAAREARAQHIMTNERGWTVGQRDAMGHKDWTAAMDFDDRERANIQRIKYRKQLREGTAGKPTTTTKTTTRTRTGGETKPTTTTTKPTTKPTAKPTTKPTTTRTTRTTKPSTPTKKPTQNTGAKIPETIATPTTPRRNSRTAK